MTTSPSDEAKRAVPYRRGVLRARCRGAQGTDVLWCPATRERKSGQSTPAPPGGIGPKRQKRRFVDLKHDGMISFGFQGKPFNITVIQVYAPVSNAEETEVERFYKTYKTF